MSKIAFLVDTPTAWQSGIWFHRNETPSVGLRGRGHGVKQLVLTKDLPQDYLEFPDTVIFGRTYPPVSDAVKNMIEFKKAGKRVLYDIDDDFWAVSKDNPSVMVSNAFKDQYEGMMKECDAITTPSEVLGRKIQKLVKKPVFICPNAIDYDVYYERPRAYQGLPDNVVTIGYMGAASHWKDLSLIVDVLEALHKKYNFFFILYGLTGEPLEAAMYTYDRLNRGNFFPEKKAYFESALDFYSHLKKIRMIHIPFFPPEIHPSILSRADMDIGLAPLEDTEFNRGKSNIKFYEYAAVGTVTLASDVEPYKSEVNYRAKNNFKDWYEKLEKLIVDVEFRKKLLKEQQDWVKENRDIKKVALNWEIACQKPGGLEVLNQQR